MTKTSYDIDLDRNPANFQPLTPLGFLERAAADEIALGGLEGAVDKEAETALATLGEAERARLPRLE